jgi:hypothetical protein
VYGYKKEGKDKKRVRPGENGENKRKRILNLKNQEISLELERTLRVHYCLSQEQHSDCSRYPQKKL